jgi:hypothetical protein
MKGICFKEDLLRKVKDGSKTQTRRLIFPNTDYSFWSQPSFEGMEKDPDSIIISDGEGGCKCYKDGEPKLHTIKGTFGLFEGDQFEFDNAYVKPKYQPVEIIYLKEPWAFEEDFPYLPVYAYDIDPLVRSLSKWNNKLFMPYKHARAWIQISDVTAQKLQEISQEDAKAEGFNTIGEFQSKWITIHGFDSWPSNPWVWKYTFKVVPLPS